VAFYVLYIVVFVLQSLCTICSRVVCVVLTAVCCLHCCVVMYTIKLCYKLCSVGVLQGQPTLGPLGDCVRIIVYDTFRCQFGVVFLLAVRNIAFLHRHAQSAPA
jgi:hypothetical protein